MPYKNDLKDFIVYSHTCFYYPRITSRGWQRPRPSPRLKPLARLSAVDTSGNAVYFLCRGWRYQRKPNHTLTSTGFFESYSIPFSLSWWFRMSYRLLKEYISAGVNRPSAESVCKSKDCSIISACRLKKYWFIDCPKESSIIGLSKRRSELIFNCARTL